MNIEDESELFHMKIEIEDADHHDIIETLPEELEIKKFHESYSDVNTEQSHGQTFDTSTKKDILRNSDPLLINVVQSKDSYPNQMPLYSKSARDIVNASLNLSNEIQNSNFTVPLIIPEEPKNSSDEKIRQLMNLKRDIMKNSLELDVENDGEFNILNNFEILKNEGFSTAENLKTQISTIHENTKQNKSSEKIRQLMNLKRDIIKNSQKVDLELIEENVEKTKIFKCELCGKVFNDLAACKYHINIVHEGKIQQKTNIPEEFNTRGIRTGALFIFIFM